MSNLCVNCKHWRPVRYQPSKCSHPELVSEKEMVYGTSTWPLAGEMRVTGECGHEGKLFEAKKKKTLTEWIFG